MNSVTTRVRGVPETAERGASLPRAGKAAATGAAGPRERRGAARLLLGTAAVVLVFPFLYMVLLSLQRTSDLGPGGLLPRPGNLTFDNYAAMARAIDVWHALGNSLVFTAGAVLATVVIGLPAGYALARLSFRGRAVTFTVLLSILVVPFVLLMIPMYVITVRDFRLADSYLGMVLPYAVNPLAVYLFRQFFRRLPAEVFEAARLDGASETRTLWRVAVPLARPAILSAVLVTCIVPWNEFLWPFLVAKNASMQPMAVGLAGFVSTLRYQGLANGFGVMMAGAVVLVLPVIVLVAVFLRWFVQVDLGSGSKG
ncbi:carbohydrate ABC transporter permease [Streptomyces sp. NPDC049954]|uniref:carbohydrate ABC transporter permease n=1 Tax=Streptomyces sp. NPDC049954 TaxID=3155779 RepID=UPI0034224317